MTARVVFFVGPPQEEDRLLRLAVPCVAAAEPVLLQAVRAGVPSGTRENVIELPAEGPEAELALLDYWTDLPATERERVWGVFGALAGALARFGDRPSRAFAVVADTESAPARPFNGQTRSLLMAAHADSWMLALDCGPDVDADLWRARLKAVLGAGWSVGCLEKPGEAARRLARAFEFDAAVMERMAPAFEAAAAAPAPASVPRGWLDRELRAAVQSVALHSEPRCHGDGRASRDAFPADDPEPRVVRGCRGRLFLGHDSHDSHRQIVGERPLTANDLDAWEHGTARRLAALTADGCRFVHLIGPAPQVVHADDLPEPQSPSHARPVRQLLERLGTGAPLLYPLDELRAAHAVHAPFSLTDSHWNDLGAYVAYEAVLRRLPGLEIRPVERGDVAFHQTVYAGDLGSKLQPERASIFLRARLDRPRARLVADNRVRNHGRQVAYECVAAPPTTCVVFGDSWAYPMMLFFAETFRRTVFRHRVNVVDRGLVEQERPDVVLVVMTERFCDTAPNDDHAADFDQLVAKRIRRGDLVPAQKPGQRYEYLYSLALDRQLPEREALRLGVSAVPGPRG